MHIYKILLVVLLLYPVLSTDSEKIEYVDTGECQLCPIPYYVGIETCQMCHIPHFESWDKTQMSKAFKLLQPNIRSEAKIKAGLDPTADYSENGECLMCHVTGYGKLGGFSSFDETPEMASVQCEMCHGPGSVYAEMMLVKRGTYTREDYIKDGGLILPSVKKNMCTDQCHNPASPFVKPNYTFNFEDRKAMGTHSHNLRYIYMPY